MNRFDCCDTHQVKDLSSHLLDFIKKFKFNTNNLDEVNLSGVTPLTLAIEQNHLNIVLQLLAVGANPLVENIHGNNPSCLTAGKTLDLIDNIDLAVQAYTCASLEYKVGAKIFYLSNCYVVIKIVQAGAGCLGAMIIMDVHTSKKYFAKIKKYVGGFEIRNYIAHNQYFGLIKIVQFINPNPLGLLIENYDSVYCLIQKYIEGEELSSALINMKDLGGKSIIVKKAIDALIDLHQQGYVHQDPLPDNCLWNQTTLTATFVDYENMRKFTDFNDYKTKYASKIYLDFYKLIIGVIPENGAIAIPGLMFYINNIEEIVMNYSDKFISQKVKTNLSSEFNRLLPGSVKLTI